MNHVKEMQFMYAYNFSVMFIYLFIYYFFDWLLTWFMHWKEQNYAIALKVTTIKCKGNVMKRNASKEMTYWSVTSLSSHKVSSSTRYMQLCSVNKITKCECLNIWYILQGAFQYFFFFFPPSKYWGCIKIIAIV